MKNLTKTKSKKAICLIAINILLILPLYSVQKVDELSSEIDRILKSKEARNYKNMGYRRDLNFFLLKNADYFKCDFFKKMIQRICARIEVENQRIEIEYLNSKKQTQTLLKEYFTLLRKAREN